MIGEMLVRAVNRTRQRDRFTLREAIFSEQRDIVAHIGPQTAFRLIGRLPVTTTQRSDRSTDILKSQTDADIWRERGIGQEVVHRVDHQTRRREMTVCRYATKSINTGILVERIQLDPNPVARVVAKRTASREARVERIVQLASQGIFESQVRKQRNTAFAADVEGRCRSRSGICGQAEYDTQDGSRHDSSCHFELLVLLAVVFA